MTTSRSFACSIWVLFILLKQSLNGASFLNTTLLFLLSIRFPFGYFLSSLRSAPAPVIGIVPFTSMHASL